MAQTFNLNLAIPTAIKAGIEKKLNNDLVIGRAARVDFKSGIKLHDEVNVIMPPRVTLNDWDGGDFENLEKVTTTIAKVKIDTGKYINFELEKAKEVQIMGAPAPEAQALIDEYTSDARYQVKDAVDETLGLLFPMAGAKIEKSGGYELTQDNFFQFLADMKAKFIRNNAWESGKMCVFIPPEAAAKALNMSLLQYTESQVKDIKTGMLAEKAGWKIYETNNIKPDSSSVYHPLFAIEGRTFAAPIQKDLEIIPYMRDESINKAFKGGFVFGASVPNAKLLGTATWKITANSYETT